jgi:hypothetical protein
LKPPGFVVFGGPHNTRISPGDKEKFEANKNASGWFAPLSSCKIKPDKFAAMVPVLISSTQSLLKHVARPVPESATSFT